MAKVTNRLTDMEVRKMTEPGRYHDGNGLYLEVHPGKGDRPGTKNWTFRFMFAGKSRSMGLGPLSQVSLKDARILAAKHKSTIASGVDPLAEKVKAVAVKAEAERKGISFGEFAEDHHDKIKSGFRNEKHRAQWITSLRTYATKLWKKPVSEIEVQDVLDRLLAVEPGSALPFWQDKNETATRVRGRIKTVLDAAAALGLRDMNMRNPAALDGVLDHLLPKVDTNKEHYAALPYKQCPALMDHLRVSSGRNVSFYALRFCILTAARSREVYGATWDEFNLKDKIWTIPAVRMKNNKEHVVPLSEDALEVLRDVKRVKQGAYVFPGQLRTKPLSAMAMTQVLRGLAEKEVIPKDAATVHGFRSSFRDWCGAAGVARENAELCLSHTIGSAVEQSYFRDTLIEKRRQIMEDWSSFLMGL